MVEQVNTDEILYQIITDRRYISAMDCNGETVDLMVRSLTPIEKSRAEYIYKQAMRRAKRCKLPTEKQCMADAIRSGWWSKDKEQLIKLRTQEIDRIKTEQERHKKNKGKSIKYRTDRIIATKALNALLDEEASLSSHSAETHARTARANYVLSRITMNVDGDPRWKSHKDFLEEQDDKFLTSVVATFNKIGTFSEKEIRAVARYSGWSIMWNVAKKSGEVLFGKPTTEYSPEQSLLCFWAIMYDNVYESMDRPSDKVIEDDEALDKWFDDQKHKTKSTGSSSQSGDVFSGHTVGGANQQEEFVMVTTNAEAVIA